MPPSDSPGGDLDSWAGRSTRTTSLEVDSSEDWWAAPGESGAAKEEEGCEAEGEWGSSSTESEEEDEDDEEEDGDILLDLAEAEIGSLESAERGADLWKSEHGGAEIGG